MEEEPGPSYTLTDNVYNSDDSVGGESDSGHSDASGLDAAQVDQPLLPEEVSSEDEEGIEFDYNLSWSENTAGLKSIPFTRENKLLVPNELLSTPYACFTYLIDDILLENICKYTNDYAWEVFGLPNLTPKSRINKWKSVSVEEMRTFIGLLLHMGTVRVNRFNDYWKNHRFFNFGFVREQMSRDRWLLILRCLHFCKNDHPQAKENRLHKVSMLVDEFNNKMSSVYYPGKDLCVDESIMLWRGRLIFRQYIKGKRHKYGVKFYSLCESDGLCLRIAIYSGKGGELGGVGHASKVVMHLMRGKLGVGHSLYMDNYYNSIPLAALLLRNDTYCTGTLRSDRKYLPRDVTGANLKKGETVARYAEGIVVSKWKDKRPVLYISTEFDNVMGTSRSKTGVIRPKPVAIIHYNADMSGVDRHDQLMSYYPCEHKSLRWYKRVFVHILQMTMINAYKLFQKANPEKKMSLYDFRLSVIETLLPPKVPVIRRPQQRGSDVHVLSKIYTKMSDQKRTSRKRCKQCKKEGKYTKTIHFCAQCPNEPGLCAVGCFDKWHTQLYIYLVNIN